MAAVAISWDPVWLFGGCSVGSTGEAFGVGVQPCLHVMFSITSDRMRLAGDDAARSLHCAWHRPESEPRSP